MDRELEVKYAAPAEVLARIAADPMIVSRTVRKETVEMSSVYYDTADGALAHRKWTLRLRQENTRSVVTMKTAGNGAARGEWEYEAATVANAAARLCALGAPEALQAILSAPVAAVCGARFTRHALTLQLDGGTAELALDRGILFRGTRETPLCELELEHKTGDTAAMFALAETLAKQYALQPEPRSKFVRAACL